MCVKTNTTSKETCQPNEHVQRYVSTSDNLKKMDRGKETSDWQGRHLFPTKSQTHPGLRPKKILMIPACHGFIWVARPFVGPDSDVL